MDYWSILYRIKTEKVSFFIASRLPSYQIFLLYNSLFRGSKVLKDVRSTRRELQIPIPEQEQTKIYKQFQLKQIRTLILRFKIENYIDYEAS